MMLPIDQKHLLEIYSSLTFTADIRVTLISIFLLFKKHFDPQGCVLSFYDLLGKREILDRFGVCDALFGELGAQQGIWSHDHLVEINFPKIGSMRFLFNEKYCNSWLKGLKPAVKQIYDWCVQIRKYQEIKEREVQLNRNERRYRILVEHAENGILITQDGIIKFANRRASSMLKVSPKMMIDQDFNPMIHPDDLHMIVDRHKRRMLGENLPEVYDFRVINFDQDIFWVELHVTLIEWEGRPATLNFLRDITIEKRLTHELQQKQKGEAIGMLAGGIAHDFGNLLMPIIGYAEMILEESSPKGFIGDSASIILDSALRAHDLVRQILTFSRKEEPLFTDINLGELIDEVLHLITSTLKKGIMIKQNIDLDHCSIYGNTTQIHQVLMNLLTNSLQAMGEAGTLSISLKQITDDEYQYCCAYYDLQNGAEEQMFLKLTISDTGIGIPSEILDRIFDPYFTTKTPGKGTGLGLAVVQGIVENHKGILDVESIADKGTSFHIYLPRIK